MSHTIKQYAVPITTSIESTFMDRVQVYAASPQEAVVKVQAQIDGETLDGDIEMEDYSGFGSMSLSTVLQFAESPFEVVEGEITVSDEEVEPSDVLTADVEELKTAVTWNTENLAKLKAFLETLGGSQIVAIGS